MTFLISGTLQMITFFFLFSNLCLVLFVCYLQAVVVVLFDVYVHQFPTLQRLLNMSDTISLLQRQSTLCISFTDESFTIGLHSVSLNTAPAALTALAAVGRVLVATFRFLAGY